MVRNTNSMVLVDCMEIVWNHDNTIIVYHLEVGISNRLDSTVSGPAGGCTLGYISYTARTVNLQNLSKIVHGGTRRSMVNVGPSEQTGVNISYFHCSRRFPDIWQYHLKLVFRMGLDSTASGPLEAMGLAMSRI